MGHVLLVHGEAGRDSGPPLLELQVHPLHQGIQQCGAHPFFYTIGLVFEILFFGVDTKQRTTNQRNYKPRTQNSETTKQGNYKTATHKMTIITLHLTNF